MIWPLGIELTYPVIAYQHAAHKIRARRSHFSLCWGKELAPKEFRGKIPDSMKKKSFLFVSLVLHFNWKHVRSLLAQQCVLFILY